MYGIVRFFMVNATLFNGGRKSDGPKRLHLYDGGLLNIFKICCEKDSACFEHSRIFIMQFSKDVCLNF